MPSDTDQKRLGQFFTPESLAKKITEFAIDYWNGLNNSQDKGQINRTINILEPSIGRGIFLKTVIDTFKENLNNNDYPLLRGRVNFLGIDIDPLMVAQSNRYLVDILDNGEFKRFFKVSIIRDNFLLPESKSNLENKFELIIGNPPHNGKYSPSQWKNIEAEPFFNNVKIYRESSVYFTIKSCKLLTNSGILAFILPKPILDSNRWSQLRKYLLTNYQLLEIWDLGNGFTGTLQEQIVLILTNKKKRKSLTKETSIKTRVLTSFDRLSNVFFTDNNYFNVTKDLCQKADNLLVGLTSDELKIVKNIFDRDFSFLNVKAFRGLGSHYRDSKGIPLVEKRTIGQGFLFKSRFFLKNRISPDNKLVNRQKQPKIIAQRIISYTTKPFFSLDLKNLYVDDKGEIIDLETVINIIPDKDIPIYALGGILVSKFVNWYLQHAIFTKTFVTSKDLDPPYLKKIPLPSTMNTQLLKAIEDNFKKYQQEALVFKTKMDLFTASRYKLNEPINPLFVLKTEKKVFKEVKNYYYSVKERKKIQTTTKIVNDSMFGELVTIFDQMAFLLIKNDELVCRLYDLSPEEILIINRSNSIQINQ